jgi:hypothetical protein
LDGTLDGSVLGCCGAHCSAAHDGRDGDDQNKFLHFVSSGTKEKGSGERSMQQTLVKSFPFPSSGSARPACQQSWIQTCESIPRLFEQSACRDVRRSEANADFAQIPEARSTLFLPGYSERRRGTGLVLKPRHERLFER